METHTSQKRWFENAIIYQIYPRSFKDTNGDGIGDIRGIIEKLDYLNDGTPQSLGVDAIWLSPVYASPMLDAGYDITDHCAIDPLFGTLEEFDELVQAAHARGMRIIMDYVTNHTSDQHPWFIESRSSKQSPKRDWYVWHTPDADGGPPNNWQSTFGGSIWEYDGTTDEYYLHHFLKEQPDLNWNNPDVRAEMHRIADFWIARGVDGFRVDAINHIYEDALFRDNPPEPERIAGAIETPKSVQLYSINQPEMSKVIATLCSIAGKHPDTFFVTESFIGLEHMLTLYEQCGEVIPFNFNLISLPWDAKHYKTFIDAFNAKLPCDKIHNYVLGNHDQPRVASRLGRDRARLTAFLQLTLKGTMFIYYGDELGMENAALQEKDVTDGAAAQAGDSTRSRDPERTPMHWNTEHAAGFTDGTPWLNVADDYQHYNVEIESADPHSFLSLYRTLIHLRTELPALRDGTYAPLTTQSPHVLAYTRTLNDDVLCVYLNFSDETIQEPLPFSTGEILYSTTPTDPEVSKAILTLQPLSGYIVKKNANSPPTASLFL